MCSSSKGRDYKAVLLVISRHFHLVTHAVTSYTLINHMLMAVTSGINWCCPFCCLSAECPVLQRDVGGDLAEAEGQMEPLRWRPSITSHPGRGSVETNQI